MWAKYEKYNNQFLQTELKEITPTNINSLVKSEFLKQHHNSEKCEQQTNTPFLESSYFSKYSALAYGSWALPKLMIELASDDRGTQCRAINSLAEYIKNPPHCETAIRKFEIIRKCQNIFLRIRFKFQKIKYHEIDRLLQIFYYCARHDCGGQLLVKRHRLLHQLYKIILEREQHISMASKILYLISKAMENRLYLINELHVLDKLLAIWQRDICIRSYPEELWLHLELILEVAPNVEFFDILHTRIKGRLWQYHQYDLKSFALLLVDTKALKRFQEIDGIRELYEILADPLHKLNTYENVVYALCNSLFSPAILWRCREFINLPRFLTKLVMESKNSNTQLYSLQALREMGTMPCIKRFIKINCLNDLKCANDLNDTNEKKRKELIYWLEREIFQSKNLTLKN